MDEEVIEDFEGPFYLCLTTVILLKVCINSQELEDKSFTILMAIMKNIVIGNAMRHKESLF